jgi:hypothetical protein
MAHGLRSRWLRAMAVGLGVVICTTLIGCQNTNSSTAPKQQSTPTTGLPGTPMLPNNSQTTKSTQPNGQFTGTGSNLQPQSGAYGQQTGMTGTNGQPTNTSGQYNNSGQNYPYGQTGPGLQQTGGMSPAPSTLYQSGTPGMNNLKSTPQTPNFSATSPGSVTPIGSPALQGVQPPLPPNGGLGGMSNSSLSGGFASSPSPPGPGLQLDGIPPPSRGALPSSDNFPIVVPPSAPPVGAPPVGSLSPIVPISPSLPGGK